MGAASKTQARRDHVQQLTRRRDWLASRIQTYRGSSDSYDRAERAAINYALRIIDAAERSGVLADLESTA